ncbi:MAG: hypothetical protein LRS43_04645, partial [Desulfurococcales archaeon]|nr:hypothetical protein [Desulfurococcales archaeon]
AKLLLFPVMGLRADASPPLPYSIDQSLMGFNGPIEAEISLTSYSGLNPDKPVLSVQELGPRGLSGYTVVLAAAALLIVGFAWRGARLG